MTNLKKLNTILTDLVRSEYLEVCEDDSLGSSDNEPSGGTTFLSGGFEALNTSGQSLNPHLPGGSYRFKNKLVMETAYSMLVQQDRKEIHLKAARLYEIRHGDNLYSVLEKLAYHYYRANELEQALIYLVQVSEKSLSNNAMRNAMISLHQLINLPDTLLSSQPLHIRASWHRKLGTSYYNLNQFAEAEEEYCKALHLLEKPIPRQGNFLHRLLSDWKRPPPMPIGNVTNPANALAVAFTEASHCYEELAILMMMRTEIDGVTALNLCISSALLAASLSGDYEGLSPEIATGLNHKADYYIQLGDSVKSKYFVDQALERSQSIDESEVRAKVLFTCSHYFMARADWDLFDRLSAKCIWLCGFLSIQGLEPKVAICISLRHMLIGSFAMCVSVLQSVESITSKSLYVAHVAYSLILVGKLQEARQIFRNSVSSTAVAFYDMYNVNVLGHMNHSNSLGVFAVIALVHGQHELAKLSALKGIKIIFHTKALRQAQGMNQYKIIKFTGIYLCALVLLELAGSSFPLYFQTKPEAIIDLKDPKNSEIGALLKFSLSKVKHYAKIYPCLSPFASYISGLYYQVFNYGWFARYHFRKAVRKAILCQSQVILALGEVQLHHYQLFPNEEFILERVDSLISCNAAQEVKAVVDAYPDFSKVKNAAETFLKGNQTNSQLNAPALLCSREALLDSTFYV
jgi:tetratricopeptide (TPR) repeat protein